MLITSATRSPVVSAETTRFAEQELLRELERRRRQLDMLNERRPVSAAGPRTAREPLVRRLRRAGRAFMEALRGTDQAADTHRAPVPAHR